MGAVIEAFNTPYCEVTATQSFIVALPIMALVGVYALVTYYRERKKKA